MKGQAKPVYRSRKQFFDYTRISVIRGTEKVENMNIFLYIYSVLEFIVLIIIIVANVMVVTTVVNIHR